MRTFAVSTRDVAVQKNVQIHQLFCRLLFRVHVFYDYILMSLRGISVVYKWRRVRAFHNIPHYEYAITCRDIVGHWWRHDAITCRGIVGRWWRRDVITSRGIDKRCWRHHLPLCRRTLMRWRCRWRGSTWCRARDPCVRTPSACWCPRGPSVKQVDGGCDVNMAGVTLRRQVWREYVQHSVTCACLHLI